MMRSQANFGCACVKLMIIIIHVTLLGMGFCFNLYKENSRESNFRLKCCWEEGKCDHLSTSICTIIITWKFWPNRAREWFSFISVVRQAAFTRYLCFKASQEAVIKPNIVIFIITEGSQLSFSTFYCNQLISSDRSGRCKNTKFCSALLSLQ